MYPGAPLIKRQGEVDAWDNADFRAAIKATNRTQIIIAGIVTDVCMCCSSPFFPSTKTDLEKGTAFLARSLRAEGYSVWANFEASGTTTKEVSTICPNNSYIIPFHLFYSFPSHSSTPRSYYSDQPPPNNLPQPMYE